jgi:hypothetical protein
LLLFAKELESGRYLISRTSQFCLSVGRNKKTSKNLLFPGEIVIRQVFVCQPGNNKTPKHAHAEPTHAQNCNPTKVSLQNSQPPKCATDTICQVVSLSSDLYSRMSKPKCEIRLLIYKGENPKAEHDMDTEVAPPQSTQGPHKQEVRLCVEQPGGSRSTWGTTTTTASTFSSPQEKG